MDFNKYFLLLQINDALFPIGGYSHSFGLETYIQKNIVTNGEKAKEYILSRINNSIKYTELLGIRLAYNEAEKENIEGLLNIDEILAASKIPSEIRTASLKMGSRFVKTIRIVSLILLQIFLMNIWHKLKIYTTLQPML